MSAPAAEITARGADWHRETATLGMWVFLATEVMFFGVLFLAYLHGRMQDAAFNTPNPVAGNRLGAVIYEATCKCSFNHNYPFASVFQLRADHRAVGGWPAVWHRNRLISGPRDRPAPDGFDSPVLR